MINIFQFSSQYKSLKKQTLVVVLSISLVTLPLTAQPIVANVAAGTASFSNSANTMKIVVSNKAIINYNSFNIAKNELLNFVQPSINSVVLNRVIMANPSSILGTLNANGKVFLVNPAGIYFGAGSSVNANSFVATTLNISDNNFLNNNYVFNKLIDAQSRAIINKGTINVSNNGFIILSAPMVSNEGRIIAKAGNIVLGATDNFYIQFDAQGLIHYDYVPVKNNDKPIIIKNEYANQIIENVLNTDSLSNAVKVTRDGDKIILSAAEGTVFNSGSLDTSADKAQNAGKIELKATNNIFILDKSHISTNAAPIGNGGIIDIYSKNLTYSDQGATYEAKGGSISGNGGFIEVSAKDSVVFDGSQIDMQTLDGLNGKFLIDPTNLTLSANSFSNGADVSFQADNKITVANGVTISTRKINGTDYLLDTSTGNSGDLSFNAQNIELGFGSKLLTFADAGFNSGDITLNAVSTSNLFTTPAIAKITINNAVLRGGAISLSSKASFDKSFDSTTTGSTDGLSSQTLKFFANSPISPIAYNKAFTDASININANSKIEGSSIDIQSVANSKSNLLTIFTGVGVGYAEVLASAQTTVANGATLKASGAINVKSDAIAENSVQVYTASLGKGRGSKVNLTLAATQTGTVSKTILENGSTIDSGGAVSINAHASKKINSTALAGSYGDGTLGVAVAISESSSTTLADASGKITANTLDVKSGTENQLLKTSSTTAAGSGFVAKILLKGANSLIDKASSFFSSKSSAANAKSGSKSPALSASFSYSEHSATTTAKLAGDVMVTDSINVQSENSYPIDPVNGAKGVKTSSIATIDTDDKNVKTYALAGAAAITILDNKAYAYIADDAKVKSDGDIDITANTYMPYEITWADINSVWDITNKLNSNFGIQDGFFTTWAQSNSAGKVVGVAGAVNYFKMKNDTQAYIGERANVNQNNPNAGKIRVIAQTDLQTLNLSGVFGLKGLGSGGGSGGVGGSYLDVSYDDITKAEIRDGAKVDASALSLIAQTKTNNISIAEAGANSGQYGVAGTFSYLKTNNLTHTTTNGATINTKNGVDDRYKADNANSNFRLMALDESKLFNVSGGITKAANVGIGASASLNEIYRDTQANAINTTFNGNGNTYISAENLGVIDAFSLAGTITTNSQIGLPSLEKGEKAKGGKYGIGFSGDSSIDTINDTAKTTIKDSVFSNNNKELIVLAKNNSKIRSYSGSVTLSTKGKKSTGFAGSYSQSTIHNITENIVQNTQINANNIHIDAKNLGSIDTFSASGSLASGGVQIAGSVSNNDITNSTSSKIITNSQLNAQGDIRAASDDTSSIKAIAGAVGFGGKAGIGASVAVNNIHNTLESSSDNSELQAQKRIDITAKNSSTIDLIVASLGVGVSGMAGSVAIGINTITNSIKSFIKGIYKKGIDAKTDIVVSSIDNSAIDSKAGQLALASKVALGASIAKNIITNTINANIENSDVATDGNIYVHAKSTKDIKNQSIAGAVSGAVAINGSVLVNNMTGTTNAHITNSKVHTKGSISLEASDVNTINMFSASLAASKYAGVGAVVALNKIHNNIDTYIDGSSDIYAGGNSALLAQSSTETPSRQSLQGLDLIAYSNEKITSTLVSGAGGVGALTGVVSVNLLGDTLNSYIDASSINTLNTYASNAQKVRVRALSLNDTAVIAGAVGVGGVSVGGTSDTTLVTNSTNTYVKDSVIHVKKSFDVDNQGYNRINNIIVAGSGGGTTGIAGSLEVLNVNTRNDAYVKNSEIFSDGDINMHSDDTINLGVKKDGTRQSIVTGAAAIGGIAGVGGSVSVITVAQDTKAHADSSKLNAKKSTNILSNTKVDLYSVAASGAISAGYLGAAGSVTVNSIDSSSQAYTSGTGMLINQDASYQTALQDVNVKADSVIGLESKVGAVGLSAGAGVGASIDVATVKNTVLAKLGDTSQTYAKHNILVQATSDKKVTSNVLAVSGGVAGVSGAVSVVNINSAINKDGADASKNTQTSTNNMLATSRVGTQLDDATLTSDVDTATSSQNVNNEFNKNDVVANSVHAVVGNSATLLSGQASTIKATESSQVTILEGVGAGGIVGVGGAVGVAIIGADTRAFVGSGATLHAGSLTIDSNFNSKNNKVQTYTGAIGFVGLGASVSKLALNYATDSYVEPTSTAIVTGTTNIKAKTDTSSIVEAKGAAVGTYAVNAVVSDVSIKGNTQANLGINSQLTTGSLSINAQNFGDINSLTQAASGGLISGSGSSSSVNSTPTVIAEVKSGAKITVTGSSDIKADASEKITSRADGISGGLLAVGVSVSNVKSKPTLRASVRSGATIKSDSFSLRTYLNRDNSGNSLNNVISSKAFSASGALVGGTGASATAVNDASLSTTIGTGSSISTLNDLNLLTLSSTNVKANADGRSYGALSVGYTSADAKNNTLLKSTIGSDAFLSTGKNMNVYTSSQAIAYADAYGGAGGLLSGGGTVAKASIQNSSNSNVGQRSKLDALNGDINILSFTNSDANAKTKINTTGAMTANVSQADAIVKQTSSILIDAGSQLHAKNINLTASSSKLSAIADAQSKTYAANSLSTANSNVDIISNIKVDIKSSAILKADKALNIFSTYTNTYTKSKAFGEIGAGVTGSVYANAKSNIILNSDITVQKNAKIYSNNIVMEAYSPKIKNDKIYIQEAQAKAATVVNYVLTAVDKIVKYVSWIPFIGKIVKKVVKTVMEWVRHILNSDTSATTPGNANYGGVLTMNGDIYQLPKATESLHVASDGTITKQGSITAQLNANKVIVNDLVNHEKGEITLRGTKNVRGNGNINLSSAYPEVKIENYSDRNLVINKINTISDNADTPNINIYSQSDTTNFTISSEILEHTLDINNFSNSDIVLTQDINNYGGITTLYNQGGNIFANSGTLLQTKSIDIATPQGSIGKAGQSLHIEFAKNGALTPFINSNSLDSTNLSLGLQKFSSTIPASNYLAGSVDLSSLNTKNNLNLELRTAKVDTTQNNPSTGALEYTQSDVKSIYNIKNVKANGDIAIEGKKGVSINLSGNLDSGKKDLLVSVGANDSFVGSSEYLQSVTPSSINLYNITQKGGHIGINLVDGILTGTGTTTLLDGFMHVKINNTTDKELRLGSINLNDRVNGSFLFNGTSVNNLVVNNLGYASGAIDINSLGTGVTTLLADISNNTGAVTLKTNNSLFNPNDSSIVGNNINFTLSNGQIGNSNHYLNIDGKLASLTNGDVYINSQNGINAETVVANGSNIFLRSADSMTLGNIKAKNINLLSNNDIDADIVSGTITATSLTGNIKIRSDNSINIDKISSAKDVFLASISGAISENNDKAIDIKANKVILKASQGIGLNHVISTDINTLDAKNNTNNIHIINKSNLEIKDIDADTYALYNKYGNIDVTTGIDSTIANNIYAGNDLKLEATNGFIKQNATSKINVGNSINAFAKNDIKASSMQAIKDITVISGRGNIFGTNSVNNTFQAGNKLTLLANNGVVGSPLQTISIKDGIGGVEIKATSSKGLVSVYVKGTSSVSNAYINQDLVLLDNKPIMGNKINEFTTILQNGSQIPSKNTPIFIQINSGNINSVRAKEDYIAN